MKPSIPSFDKKRTKGRAHPFLGSREFKSSTTSYINDLVAEEDRLSSPRTTSTIVATPRADVLSVSKTSFNAPQSNRSSVKILEEDAHKELRDIFLEEKMGKISRQERHLTQIQILDNSMKDLCTLINKNCKDQANFVWKLWSSAADLYQEVLKQLMDDMEANKRQLVAKSLQIEELEKVVETLKKQQGIFSGNDGSSSLDELAIIRQLEEDLNAKDAEFLRVQETMTNLSLWFPHFAKFGSSVLGRFLPPIDENEELAVFGAIHDPNQEVQDDLKSLKNHFYLAQDYLIFDLKRLEKLGVGLEICHNNPSNQDAGHSYSRSYRPPRDVPVSNKLSIALNQPEELQALSYGLFGGPQSSLSFSSARENEYNLRHIEAGSIISPKNNAMPLASPTNDVDTAVERAVAAVTKSRTDTSTNSQLKARNTPEGDFDIRLFHALQYRRASNLSVKGYADDAKEEVIDMSKFVAREDFDALSNTQHQAMVTIQELERNLHKEQENAAQRIERLEKELKATQQREKALVAQLKECQNEADSILECLPSTCSLPPLCNRSEFWPSDPSKGRKRVAVQCLSSFTLPEAIEHSMFMLRHFSFVQGDLVTSSNHWYFTHLDNALNGHNTHWLAIEPRPVTLAQGLSFHSVALGMLAPAFGGARWKSPFQVAQTVTSLASSVLSLIVDEIMRSYRDSHLVENYFNSSQSPWEAPMPTDANPIRSAASEHLLFLSKLFGYRISVEPPDGETESSVEMPSVYVVGMAETSIASQFDQIFALPNAKPNPPAIFFQELSLKDQRIFFDVVARCHEAVKSCGSRHDFFVPLRDISKVLHKVFSILDVAAVVTPFDMADTLLEERGLHMRPWWRYLSPKIEKRLQEECLRIALDAQPEAESLADDDADDDENWLQSAVPAESLNFSQLCMTCYYATVEFERALRRCLQDLFVFLQSLVPAGPSSPLYFVTLEKILLPMPASELQTTDSAASRTKKSTVPAEVNRSPGLPLAFVEELHLLDSEHQLTAATFADALLRCAPSKCVERLSTVLCLYDFQPVQKPAQKHGLEDIARAGLNLNLYQQASGAFDFSSDDVLGRKFARTASSTGKDKLTLAWEKLGAHGKLLLQLTERIMNQSSKQPHGGSVSRISPRGDKRPIPELATSVFLRSARYRRQLYGSSQSNQHHSNSSAVINKSGSAEGNRDNDDDADDDATFKAADDGIDYATRILYHLRLCFDSEMIAISDASVAHKWLTAALVETLLHPTDVSHIRDQLARGDYAGRADPLMRIADDTAAPWTTEAQLALDEAVAEKRAAMHRRVVRLSALFQAWKKFSRRRQKK